MRGQDGERCSGGEGVKGRYGLISAWRRRYGVGWEWEWGGAGGAYEDVHFLVEPVVEEQVVAHPDACAHPQSPSCFRGCGGGSVPLASRELLCLSRMPRARQQKTEGTKEEVWWTRGFRELCQQPKGVEELSTQFLGLGMGIGWRGEIRWGFMGWPGP